MMRDGLPIVVLKGQKKLPPEDCYVVAGNGNFIKKDVGWAIAVVPVGGIGFLDSLAPVFQLQLPKIPAKLIIKSLLFFRKVWKEWRSEAITLLHYSYGVKRYRLWCPAQKVIGAKIASYDDSERFRNYCLVGTIHSHCNFRAGHSSGDERDEKHFDGLHITIGHVEQLRNFSLSASAMVNGYRFLLETEKVIEGMEKMKQKDFRHYQFPKNWLEKVEGNYEF